MKEGIVARKKEYNEFIKLKGIIGQSNFLCSVLIIILYGMKLKKKTEKKRYKWNKLYH